jgi:non-heme chloroperoxidase
MPFFTTDDGTSLFYRDWGRGEPLVFLSSLGVGSALWDYQFSALATAGFRCVGLDRRGHGRSDQPPGGYDFDTLAEDIAALLETLALERVTLISHSMGGCELVRYLTRHGTRRVARAVLISPTTPKLLQSADHPQGLPRALFEATWEQWRRDYPQWIEDNLAPFVVPETSRPLMRWAASLLQTPVPIALALSRAMVEADFRAEMRSIELPALIIHGDRDRSAPLELTGQPSAALLPQARLLVYRGAPHGLMLTHQERLHADLQQFAGAA